MTAQAIARRFSVLVVDDDQATADALARLLRKHDYDVRVAYDAERAMELFRSCPAGRRGGCWRAIRLAETAGDFR